MEYKSILNERYATKSFDRKKIPEEQITALKEIIQLTPTSFNVQPWRAMVIGDAERKEALVEVAWGQPQVTTCSHLFVFCANTELEVLVDRLESRMVESGTPQDKAAAFIGMIRGFLEKLPAEYRLPWAQRQSYLALANGLNGAKSLGFDSCPMEGFMPEKFSEILKLPETLVPTVLMAVGYASDKSRPKIRFTTDELFFTGL